jgi:hypothetical protein
MLRTMHTCGDEHAPSILFGRMLSTRMTPSLLPVSTMSSVTATRVSTEAGWPGNRSDVSWISDRSKMLSTPSWLPHTTLVPPFTRVTACTPCCEGERGQM